MSFAHRLALPAVAAASLAAGLPASAPHAAAVVPPIRHVWVLVLENESYDATFTHNPNPYLPHVLPSLGAMLTQYYGTGHASLDNYVAMVSGQGAAVATQADCLAYGDVEPGAPSPTGGGQVLDDSPTGCVYPAAVPTVADQVSQAGLTWKGYMGDLGKDPARDAATTCTDPRTPPAQDRTQSAEAADQYATRHDPFMYFHSVIDSPLCRTNVVNLTSPGSGLAHDLAAVATTPNFSFITPNLCDDGHDGPTCADGEAGGLAGIDRFLSHWVPRITASPAFRQDGLLAVIFDEASTSDTTACCNQPASPNTPAAGGTNGGTGGGRTGAVLLSPFIRPGTRTDAPYNHFSLLRSVEDALGIHTGGSDGLGHLGFAGAAGLAPFGADVYTAAQPVVSGTAGATSGAGSSGASPGLANTAAATLSPVGAPAAAVAVAAVLVAGRRRRR